MQIFKGDVSLRGVKFWRNADYVEMNKSIKINSESTKIQYLRKSAQTTRYQRYSRKRKVESNVSDKTYCSYNHCMEIFHTTHCFEKHLFCKKEQRNGRKCDIHEEIFDKIPKLLESTKNQYLLKSVETASHHATKNCKFYNCLWKNNKNQYLRKPVQTTRYHATGNCKSYKSLWKNNKNHYLRKPVRTTNNHSTGNFKSYKSRWKNNRNHYLRKPVQTTSHQSSQKRKIESKVSGRTYCSYNHCRMFHATRCFQKHLFFKEQRNRHKCGQHEEIFDKTPRFPIHQPHKLIIDINRNSLIAHNHIIRINI